MANPTAGARSRALPPDAKAPSPRRRAALAAFTLTLAGILAAGSAASPWWYLSTASGGSTFLVEYLPGNDLRVASVGGGGTTSYAAAGVASIGSMYVSVLAAAVVLALLAWTLAGYGLGRATGRWGGPRTRRLARAALLAGIGLSLVLAVAVPVVQPALYNAANPKGVCSSGYAPGACSSFWGSSHGVANSTSWGAGLGWWLDVGVAVLFGLGLLLRTFATVATEDRARLRAASSRSASRARDRGPVRLVDLQRLAELKRESDRGGVPLEAFLEAKQRLLADAPGASTAAPDPRAPLPSEELALLRALRDDGALSQEEYELLERRVLLWV